MSAHCNECGNDLVYAGEWPAMECPVCTLRERLEAAEKERDEAKARIGVPPWACANCDFTLNWGPDCATCGTLRGNADGKSTEDDQVRDLSVEASWRADLWEQEKKRANAAEAERDRLAAALERTRADIVRHNDAISGADGGLEAHDQPCAVCEALNPGDQS